jgi:cystathionine beta-lyase
MTHKSIPPQKRRAAGVEDGLIRISVGLEEAGDLITDLEQVLNSLSGKEDKNKEINKIKEEKQFQFYNA